MPELPEVETTRRGLASRVETASIIDVTVRNSRLRWPVPPNLPGLLLGNATQALDRRGKYLLFRFAHGTLIVHLGMSGSLRMTTPEEAWRKHDHIQLLLSGGQALRFHDPRRFGAFLWTDHPPLEHPLLKELGPEPLSESFDGAYLHKLAHGRTVAVKSLLMDSHVVVGVGNIYANEALFRAGIRPLRAAGRVGRERYGRLAQAVKAVLAEAIAQGGTTLRDFVNGHGQPGYFQQTLQVYGRAGLPCRGCAAPIQTQRIGQRSTYFCPVCQR